MKGRFIVAGEDAETRRPLLATAPYWLSNALFFAYYSACMRTSRATWSPSPDALLSHAGEHRRPIVYYAWHGDSWWLITAMLALPPSLRPVGICNDGIRSRLNSRSSAWLGIDMFEFAQHAERSRRRQIIDFIRDSGRNIMLFPDAGGPYRQLKPGILTIAREAGAELVPVRLQARPAVRFGKVMQHRVPVPFSRLAAAWGPPLSAEHCSTEDVEAALQALHGESVPKPAAG